MNFSIDEGLGWLLFAAIIGIVIVKMGAMHMGHVTEIHMKDREVQLVLAEAGHSPMSISCAYNMETPTCLLMAERGLND